MGWGITIVVLTTLINLINIYPFSIINMFQIILYALASIFAVAVIWLILPYKTWKSVRKTEQKEEITIITLEGRRLALSDFRKVQKNSYLSLVVPSYNEEARLPVMLEETAQYLKDHKYASEIIVVNDGSKDNTTNVAL